MVLDIMSKLTKITTVTLCITLLLIGLNVVEQAWSSQSDGVVVVDALGRVVNIDSTPNRIVSLAPSITEIIFVLSNQHRLVGVDSISYSTRHLGIADYVRERNVIDVGGYWWTLVNIEAILALNPDLILADKGAHTPLLNVFEEYGLKVVYLNGGSAQTLEDVFNDIRLVGKILDVPNLAEKFVLDVEETFREYREAIANSYRPVKYLFIVYINGGIWVVGRNTFINDVFSRLGLANIVEQEGWVVLSPEDVAQLKPDLTLVALMGDEESTRRLIETYELNEFTKILYVLNADETDYLLRPGPLVINAPIVVKGLLEKTGFWRPPVVSQFPCIWITVLAVILAYLYLKARFK